MVLTGCPVPTQPTIPCQNLNVTVAKEVPCERVFGPGRPMENMFRKDHPCHWHAATPKDGQMAYGSPDQHCQTTTGTSSSKLNLLMSLGGSRLVSGKSRYGMQQPSFWAPHPSQTGEGCDEIPTWDVNPSQEQVVPSVSNRDGESNIRKPPISSSSADISGNCLAQTLLNF